MSKSSPVGFREVLVDQPFMGKWMDVDMNLGGGHTTFQGTKFSDFAGGFSYRTANGGKAGGVVQNRCIYWRTLNDTLELTEISMNYNLVDNQVRYIFQDSPIVGPVAIQETENSVVILVATVTSVNRFVFTHPKRIEEMQIPGDKVSTGSTRPSIFFQVCNQPQMNFKSFNLYENAINISVPLCAACQYIDRGPLGDCVFAFSFENGKIHVYKVSRDDVLTSHDLKQSNLFAKISGFASQFLKGPTSSPDAVIGMNFFTTKGGKGKTIELVTLGMNGTLNLWHCPSLDVFNEWFIKPFGLVDARFAIDGATDSSMLLRKTQEPKQLPKFCVYLPRCGFKFYQVVKNADVQFNSSTSLPNNCPYALVENDVFNFRGQELIDFSLTSDFLFVLVSNAEEETEWEVKYCQFTCDVVWQTYKTFRKAILEKIPDSDVEVYPTCMDAKEFYMDVIFNKCSFNAVTIIKALSMFKKEGDEEIKDKDWESLKVTAMNIIYREIGIATSHSDFGLADDEFAELSLKYWLQFYNSCVEYHIHTVKPLGLFFESNTKMLCIVKKSRISFLRPTSFLESLYYYPQFYACPDASEQTDEQEFRNLMLTKYMNLIKMIENLLVEPYSRRIEKHLRMDHDRVFDLCQDIVTMMVDNDPSCVYGEKRKIVPELTKRLKDLGSVGTNVMKLVIMNLHSWEMDSSVLGEVGGVDEGDEEEDDGASNVVSDKFMGSRIGSHLAFKCLKQLLDHRYMIARDTLLLKELVACLIGPPINREDERHLEFDEDDKYAALSAMLNYFAWRQLANQGMIPAKPFLKDRGLKIANILKIYTGDHLKPNDNSYLDTFWPSKTIEAFLSSQVGGLAARSRVSGERSKSCVLAFAEATGRALWEINEEMSRDRPFEDFLISSCQYTTLLKYATYMRDYFTWAKYPSKRFYTGLAHLCLDRVDLSLQFFTRVIGVDLETDMYFIHKVLEGPPPNCEQSVAPSAACRLEYYIKVIRMFQVFECSSCVKRLAEDAFTLATQEGNDGVATQMCSLSFKTSLSLEDYHGAYRSVLQMPSYEEEEGGDRRERKEKLASLRMLISTLIQRKEVNVLLALNFNVPFNETDSMREQVENILFAQANLSDPLCTTGAYQMLYLYHLKRGNFHKGADLMYHRAMRIGDKGTGLEGLEAQKESYLDALTCLELVKPATFKYVVQHTGITPEPQKSYPVNIGDMEVQLAPFTKEAVVVVRTLDEVQSELELVIFMVKLAKGNRMIPNPVKMFNFEAEAKKTVDCLAVNHYYDDAIKLAQLWGLEVTPIVSAFVNVCTNLVHDVLPDNEDPYEYVRYNDLSELPGTEGVVDISFRLLRRYVETLEAPVESTLHKEVTLKLIAADVELPQWLVSSYKKRNTGQFLRCYMDYGLWDEATKLTLHILDATLGRRDCSEFDITVIKISAYEHAEPQIPYTNINLLIDVLEDRSQKEPALKKMADDIKAKVGLYRDRILECRRERRAMAQL